MPKLFLVDDDVAEKIKTWAAKDGDGGWQNLCAAIWRGRQDSFAEVLHLARLEGISRAIDTLENLRTAEDARDV